MPWANGSRACHFRSATTATYHFVGRVRWHTVSPFPDRVTLAGVSTASPQALTSGSADGAVAAVSHCLSLWLHSHSGLSLWLHLRSGLSLWLHSHSGSYCGFTVILLWLCSHSVSHCCTHSGSNCSCVSQVSLRLNSPKCLSCGRTLQCLYCACTPQCLC